MDREIVRYLIEIQGDIRQLSEQVSSIEKQGAKRDAELEVIKEDVIKAKASLKAIRWVSGILFVTVPATAAALVRIFKGG